MSDTVPVHERKAIGPLKPYVPGISPEKLKREFNIEGAIKLSGNENPLGPSPAAVEAVRAHAAGINRYPDGSCEILRNHLAGSFDLDPGMFVMGNGSNELIELLIRAFVDPGDEIVMSTPSFVVYRSASIAAGASIVEIPLTDDFTHDLKTMASVLTDKTRIVFLDNPNNPSGTYITKSALETFLGRISPDVLVVMDCAYGEYAIAEDFPDHVEMLKSGRQIAVLKTFSKIHALAGLRLGVMMLPAGLAASVEKIRQPFNVNSLAQAAAIAAFDDKEHVARSKQMNRMQMAVLEKGLRSMKIPFVPGQGNFILARTGLETAQINEELIRRGVIIRLPGGGRMAQMMRVTVGTGEENERFLSALSEALRITGRKDT